MALVVAVVVVAIVAGALLLARPTGSSDRRRSVVANAPAVAPYVVHGDRLVDGKGRTFFIHGVNRPSLEWSCTGESLDGLPGIPASDFATMASWGANTVRLPLNQDYWLSSKGVPVTPGEHCPNYVATVKTAVHDAESAGLAVILDLHASDPGSTLRRAGPQVMPDQASVRFWSSVAKTFGSDRDIFFELFNEPRDVSWAVWQHGGAVTSDGYHYRGVGMQQLVDAVRATGTHDVILVDGPDFAARLGGVPTHSLRGGGIGYVVHPYAGVDGTDPHTWEKRFGFLAARRLVVATEFGDQRPGVTPYDRSILRFFRTHGIGWTAWAWWAGGYRFPSLVSGPGGRCVDAGCPDRAALLSFAAGHSPMLLPRSGAVRRG